MVHWCVLTIACMVLTVLKNNRSPLERDKQNAFGPPLRFGGEQEKYAITQNFNMVISKALVSPFMLCWLGCTM